MKPRPWDESHPSNWFRSSPETELAAVKERINRIETVLLRKFGPEILDSVTQRPATPVNKRGPAPRITSEHLYYERERIIDFLEFYWPELRVEFQKKNKKTLALKLTRLSHSANSSYNPTAELFLHRLDALLSFLNSPEWNGDPRVAAGALAGVPTISWTTSLKKCRKIPTQRAVGVRALRDYLHRNFSSTFTMLLKCHTAEDIQRAMARVTTKDREFNWLRDNPEDVLAIMRIGQRNVYR